MSGQIQNIVIAPFVTGLDTDTYPWLAPPDSFREAENVHVHHGYLEKRSGYRLFGTLSNGTRVMGIQRFIQSDGLKELICFDTRSAYRYNTATNLFDILDAGDIFSGGQYDYIQGVNWQSSNVLNRLYFTNGLQWNGTSLNGIRYYTSATPTITVAFNPSTGGGNTLYGCKLLFTLGQRIIALFTYENDGVSTTAHPQRARWCAKQSPNNWNDITAGGGDFADAATGDQIISAQTLQNQIIVFFSNSIWSLQPTADPNKAFRWIRLNNYRACDGKMASVAYDRNAIALGIRGIMASDGSQSQRIDNRIMEFVSSNINYSEFRKVFCYRSFETARWWTLYPSSESTENNKALIYDDDSKAFTTYEIDLNCMGYGNTDIIYRLSDFTSGNNLDFSIDQMGNDTLQDWGFNATEDILLGGDISGNIYELEFGAKDINNDINATFTTASWNPYIKEGVEAQMVYVDFYVDTEKSTTGRVEFYVNDQLAPYTTQDITFLPNLNFVSSVVNATNANPCVINSPQHGLSTDDRVYIYGAQGMVELNSSGFNITVINENFFSLNNTDSTTWGFYTGGAQVYLKEFYQTRTWMRAYGGAIGFSHWIKVTLFGGDKPFRFHSIKPGFRKRGNRVIN